MPRSESIRRYRWIHTYGTTCGIALLALGLGVVCTQSTTGGSIDVNALPTLQVAEDRRIGSVDDPNSGFSRIGGVDVDRDGQVYVYELLDNQIRVYEDNGILKHVIGGPGEGPGEFRMLRRFGVVGDTVWVIDIGLRRITLFERSGGVVSTGQFSGVSVDLQRQDMSGMVMPRAMRKDGLFTADMSMFVSRRGSGPTGIGAEDTVAVPRVLFNASGNVVDTIAWDPYPPPQQGSSEYIEVATTRYVVPRPPSDQPLTVSMDDGRFLTDRQRAASDQPASFVVTRVTELGDTVYSREFQYMPQRFSSAALDSVAWRSARIPGGAYSPFTGPAPTPEGVDINAVRSRIRDAMDFPEFQPPVYSGIAGGDGTLWLRREDEGGTTYRWTVIDPEGSPRGELDLPRGLLIRWVSGDQLWAVELDEFDIPWLVRYAIKS